MKNRYKTMQVEFLENMSTGDKQDAVRNAAFRANLFSRTACSGYIGQQPN